MKSIDTCLIGLENCPVIIVADGFQLDKENRTKKGFRLQYLCNMYLQVMGFRLCASLFPRANNRRINACL